MPRVFDDGIGLEARWAVAPPRSTARTAACEVSAALRSSGEGPPPDVPTLVLVVSFLDASAVRVTARVDDTARSVLGAAALRVGVGPE